MTELDNNLPGSGEGTSLKHFIYLDRSRINSYSSQLLDGIVQLRRLTENEGNSSAQSSDEEYTEEVQEDGKEGEVSIGPKNYAGGMSGKSVNKLTTRKGFRKGANTLNNDFSQSLLEEKIDYDNGYLNIEKQLIIRKFLTEIRDESELKQYSSLIKITATSRFFDWDSILQVMTQEQVTLAYLEQNVNQNAGKGFNEKKKHTKNQGIAQVKAGIATLKALSLGSITVHTKIGNSNLVGSLNPVHLCMTREQLRSAYVMPGDVEITVVGFVPRRKVEQIEFPGVTGSINMIDFLSNLLGKVDIMIDPIAIYTEVQKS